MVRSETPEPAGAEQSLGDLVALAAKDVSQLIRYEIDLAKTELSEDVRRVGMAVVLVGLAAFVGCLVLVMLCFALRVGPDRAAASGAGRPSSSSRARCVLLAAIALGIAVLRVRNMSGLRKTRQTVTEGLGMLRQNGQQPDGQRPELTGRKTR